MQRAQSYASNNSQFDVKKLSLKLQPLTLVQLMFSLPRIASFFLTNFLNNDAIQ